MRQKKLMKLRQNLKKNVLRLRRRIHDRHIKRTTVALLLTLPYLLTEWTARAYDLYVVWPPIDNFVHASFGIAFAAIAYLIYDKKIRIISLGAFIVSVIWEIYEIIGDYFPAGSRILDPFFYDGIKDISVTFISAVITAFIIRRFMKRHYFRVVVD